MAEASPHDTAARPAEPEPLLWDRERAARALNVHPKTLARMDADGKLPPGAVIRAFGRKVLYSRVVLERWVLEGCPVVLRPARGTGRR